MNEYLTPSVITSCLRLIETAHDVCHEGVLLAKMAARLSSTRAEAKSLELLRMARDKAAAVSNEVAKSSVLLILAETYSALGQHNEALSVSHEAWRLVAGTREAGAFLSLARLGSLFHDLHQEVQVNEIVDFTLRQAEGQPGFLRSMCLLEAMKLTCRINRISSALDLLSRIPKTDRKRIAELLALYLIANSPDEAKAQLLPWIQATGMQTPISLARFAQTFFVMNDIPEYEQLLDDAFRLIQSMDQGFERSAAIFVIIEVLALTQKKDRARELLMENWYPLLRSPSPDWLVRSGMQAAYFADDLDSALAALNRMQDQGVQESAMEWIILELAGCARLPMAVSLIEKFAKDRSRKARFLCYAILKTPSDALDAEFVHTVEMNSTRQP